MPAPPRPTADEILLAPELALLAALDALLDLTQRTLEAAWPELGAPPDDEEHLVHRILQLAEELREALADYRDVVTRPLHD